MKKKYLILGLKKSGQAAADFLLKRKIKIIGFDDNLNLNDENILELKKNGLEIVKNIKNFEEIEKIIISPGINPTHEIIKTARKYKNIEVISEIELGLRYLKNFCIGITGTNGKTTLTKLLCHVLNENNKKAVFLGNIGICLTSQIDKLNQDDISILELSSFQLETIKTKALDLAVIINITEDHLDRYPSFLDYAKAKLNIINALKKNKILYTNKSVLQTYLLDKKINIKQVEDDIEDIALNICLDLKITKENFLKACKSFKKDEHTLEFVREINDIYFYNDSEATNVNAVIYAVKKISRPIILIAGGIDKNVSFKIWEKPFLNKVKYILTIGQSAKKIKKELTGFDVQIVENLELAVKKAYSLAKKNECVLLSCGCSSFDMFQNCQQRGEVFKKIVTSL